MRAMQVKKKMDTKSGKYKVIYEPAVILLKKKKDNLKHVQN